MKFGSLFSGIGGIDLGLERSGMECRWQVENEPYCAKVLAKHWPEVKRYGDIKKVDWKEVEHVDLVCGGFPCQPVSTAGKQLRQEDERWLWPEFARAVRHLRPRYVLVENVPGLLVGGMGDVLEGLASLGYDAEWESLPASAFGAPHLRYRVFLVACKQGTSSGVSDSLFRDLRIERERYGEQYRERRPTIARNDGSEGSLADTDSRRFEGKRKPEHGKLEGSRRNKPDGRSAGRRRKGSPFIASSSWWIVEPNVGRVAHGVPSRVDRLKALGNAVLPQAIEWIGRLILKREMEVSNEAERPSIL